MQDFRVADISSTEFCQETNFSDDSLNDPRCSNLIDHPILFDFLLSALEKTDQISLFINYAERADSVPAHYFLRVRV